MKHGSPWTSLSKTNLILKSSKCTFSLDCTPAGQRFPSCGINITQCCPLVDTSCCIHLNLLICILHTTCSMQILLCAKFNMQMHQSFTLNIYALTEFTVQDFLCTQNTKNIWVSHFFLIQNLVFFDDFLFKNL